MLQRDKFAIVILISFIGNCYMKWLVYMEKDMNLCKISKINECESLEDYQFEDDETVCLNINKIPPCLINSTRYLCNLEVVCGRKLIYDAIVNLDVEPLLDDYIDRKNKNIVKNYMNIYYGVFLVYNFAAGLWFNRYITWRLFWMVSFIMPKSWYDKIIGYWIATHRYAYYRG